MTELPETSLAVPKTSLAVPDGMRLQSWWESRDVPRSTAFRLVKAAGLELGKARVPGARGAVTVLTEQQVRILDAMHGQLQRGRTLAELEGAGLALREDLETAHDVPHQPVDLDALERRAAVTSAVLAAGLPLSTRELAALLGCRPGSSTITRGDLEAVRQGRDCWRLRRVDASLDASETSRDV
jgi:hypothetical protein